MKTNKNDQGGELEDRIKLSDEMKEELNKLADIPLEGFMDMEDRKYSKQEEEK